ncbi:type I restriction enzyme HsdR N-terminal domain-containing protein [uncultured Bacteroides sp.]|uniref:type I restriction enzyme HsdR N-terminal domain-containing protein n=1 Tax=uncultured Bacteroides sp. TaxID=162156 RepID=UPI002621E803|nr:type I restriction enzyme HsdR N-terminal domain-containing protein [uncultured Bacteroides sp.]
MLSLNLPSASLKIADVSGKKQVFDILRKKYVALTPEEWVRQHFVHYLIRHLGYPSGLLANEVGITLNGCSRRCDTVLYDTSLSPRMIVEYKASDVPITRKVFSQILRYNIVLRVDYLIVSNGLNHYCCKVDYTTGTTTFLTSVPHYSEL